MATVFSKTLEVAKRNIDKDSLKHGGVAHDEI